MNAGAIRYLAAMARERRAIRFLWWMVGFSLVLLGVALYALWFLV